MTSPPRDSHEGLGDVICRLAPFLKLYTTYTAGFEDAMKLLTEWTEKSKKFDSLVREFEVSWAAAAAGSGFFLPSLLLPPPSWRERGREGGRIDLAS